MGLFELFYAASRRYCRGKRQCKNNPCAPKSLSRLFCSIPMRACCCRVVGGLVRFISSMSVVVVTGLTPLRKALQLLPLFKEFLKREIRCVPQLPWIILKWSWFPKMQVTEWCLLQCSGVDQQFLADQWSVQTIRIAGEKGTENLNRGSFFLEEFSTIGKRRLWDMISIMYPSSPWSGETAASRDGKIRQDLNGGRDPLEDSSTPRKGMQREGYLWEISFIILHGCLSHDVAKAMQQCTALADACTTLSQARYSTSLCLKSAWGQNFNHMGLLCFLHQRAITALSQVFWAPKAKPIEVSFWLECTPLTWQSNCCIAKMYVSEHLHLFRKMTSSFACWQVCRNI